MNFKNRKEGILVSSSQNVLYAIYAWQYKIYIIKNIILFCFFVLKARSPVHSRLTLNLLCSWEWLELLTSCPYLPSAGIAGGCHHIWLIMPFFSDKTWLQNYKCNCDEMLFSVTEAKLLNHAMDLPLEKRENEYIGHSVYIHLFCSRVVKMCHLWKRLSSYFPVATLLDYRYLVWRDKRRSRSSIRMRLIGSQGM